VGYLYVLIRNPNAKVVRVNIFNGWSVGFSAKVVVQANMEFVLGESGVGFGYVSNFASHLHIRSVNLRRDVGEAMGSDF